MSLPKLISKISRFTPTFVTVDGMVLSGDQVTLTNSGYRHALHGPVTAVSIHSDHGGTVAEVRNQTPWWASSPEHLRNEAAAVKRAFPGFRLTRFNGSPAYSGEINTGRGRFGIVVMHRPDHSLPLVIPLQPSLYRRIEGRTIRRSPHLYDNGNLCVASLSDWDPRRHDATTAIAWAAHWLASFTEWRITGQWPMERTEVEAAVHPHDDERTND